MPTALKCVSWAFPSHIDLILHSVDPTTWASSRCFHHESGESRAMGPWRCRGDPGDFVGDFLSGLSRLRSLHGAGSPWPGQDIPLAPPSLCAGIGRRHGYRCRLGHFPAGGTLEEQGSWLARFRIPHCETSNAKLGLCAPPPLLAALQLCSSLCTVGSRTCTCTCTPTQTGMHTTRPRMVLAFTPPSPKHDGRHFQSAAAQHDAPSLLCSD